MALMEMDMASELPDLSEAAARTWAQRHELNNWNGHVSAVLERAREEGPAFRHEAAEQAFRLVVSLVKNVAVPEGYDLALSDIFDLCQLVVAEQVAA